MSNLPTKYKAVACFLIAVVGGGIAQGLIVGAAAAWATVVIGAAATVGVYQTKNEPGAVPPVEHEGGAMRRGPLGGDAGSVDAGSLALGVVVAILVIWFFAAR